MTTSVVASAAVFSVTILALLLLCSGGCVAHIYTDWKSQQRDVALRAKRGKLASPFFTCCAVLAGLSFVLTALAVQQLRSDTSSLFAYDPWAVLELPDSTKDEGVIKQAYRRLSRVHHPDRGGDAATFQKIARAYNTLSDPKALRNFNEFGNPEGTYLNIAEMPAWLSAGGKDAGKTKALLVFGGLLGGLFSFLACGMCLVRNRGMLNNYETGGDGERDPVASFARLNSAQRREYVRRLNESLDTGKMDRSEFDDWMDVVNKGEAKVKAEAAELAAKMAAKGKASAAKPVAKTT